MTATLKERAMHQENTDRQSENYLLPEPGISLNPTCPETVIALEDPNPGSRRRGEDPRS